MPGLTPSHENEYNRLTVSRKHTLIPFPLAWSTAWTKTATVPHPPLPVIAERGGTQRRRPLPVAIVGTRGQNPLSFRHFKGWFARIEHRTLRLAYLWLHFQKSANRQPDCRFLIPAAPIILPVFPLSAR